MLPVLILVCGVDSVFVVSLSLFLFSFFYFLFFAFIVRLLFCSGGGQRKKKEKSRPAVDGFRNSKSLSSEICLFLFLFLFSPCSFVDRIVSAAGVGRAQEGTRLKNPEGPRIGRTGRKRPQKEAETR